MSKRAAVIVGSTGAIGRQLMPLLAASPRFEKLILLHHRPTPYARAPKVDERIVDFTFDEATAYPQAADGVVCYATCVDATSNFLLLESLLPRFAGIGNDQLLANNQPVDLQHLVRRLAGLQQSVGGGDGEEDGDEAFFHGRVLLLSTIRYA